MAIDPHVVSLFGPTQADRRTMQAEVDRRAQERGLQKQLMGFAEEGHGDAIYEWRDPAAYQAIEQEVQNEFAPRYGVPDDIQRFFDSGGSWFAGYGEGDRAMGYDPLTGQFVGLSQIDLPTTDDGHVGGGMIPIPTYLADQYPQLGARWTERDFGGGSFFDKLGDLVVPSAAMFLASGGAAGPLAGALGGGMLGTAGAGAILGGLGSTVMGGDPLQGALTGGLGGLAGPALASSLNIPTWLASAIGSAGVGMLSGMDVKKALASAALGAGLGFGMEGIGTAFETPAPDVAEVGQSAYDLDEAFAAMDADAIKRRPIQLADASDFSTLATDAFYGPEPTQPPPLLTPTTADQMFSQFATNLTLAEEDAANRDALEAGDNPPPAPTSSTSDTAQRYAKIAKHLIEMLGKQGEGAPQRDPGEDGEMSPEEEQAYFDQVVAYLGLDPATMAEAGLVPGSPEYLDYILSQIDSIIGQVIGDANPDGEDFGALLRAKTDEELQALNRAVYIRGQLGSLVGPGQYEDPLTGMIEDVAAQPGAKFRPGVAAWQRGLARSAEELAGMRGQEAKRFLGGMLERRPDIYGMQARRDATALREALESQNPDLKRRRRGMFADEDYFGASLEGMNSIELDRMLALLMGRDSERQGAAVEELFGWTPEPA
jgi:hypothetical protein